MGNNGREFGFSKLLISLFFIAAFISTGIVSVKIFNKEWLSSLSLTIFIFLIIILVFLWIRIFTDRRKPGVFLTGFILLTLCLVLAFVGISPFSGYKDSAFNKIATYFPKPIDNPSPSLQPSTPQSAFTSPSSVPFTSTVRATSAPPSSEITPLPGPSVSVGKDYKIIDSHSLGAPSSTEGSIAALAAYLTLPAQNDLEKTRAIYIWVTQNVSYDFQAYLTKNYGSTSAENVLVSRSSVCAGYSNLFNALAKSAGLNVVTISGWAKGFGYNIGDQISGPSNHAWNAVKIGVGWYLVDSTWGAGYINQQNLFVREFNDAYFLTPPDQFIYDHFPEESKWQLLKTPLSRLDFAELPRTESKYFSYGLKPDIALQSVIKTSGVASISIPVPNDVVLCASLFQGNQMQPDTLTLAQRAGGVYQIRAVCPIAGNYVLRIYAKNKNESGSFSPILELKIESDGGSSPQMGFPKQYGQFISNDVYLDTPLSGLLKSGDVQNFSLNVPNATDVQIVIGSTWYALTKQGDQFRGALTVTQGPIKVCARFVNSSQYNVLLEYTVQ